MRENRTCGSEGGEGNLPDPYQANRSKTRAHEDVDRRNACGDDGSGTENHSFVILALVARIVRPWGRFVSQVGVLAM